MDTPKRRLVLHFDLDKTITMRGDLSEKGVEEALVRKMVNTMAWGRVEQRPRDKKDKTLVNVWICSHDGLSPDCPDESLVNYQYSCAHSRTFLEREFALKEEEGEEGEEFNAEQRKRIEERMENFVKPGNPGVKLKKIHDKMLARLELPKHVKEALGIVDAPPSGDEPAKESQGEEKVEEGEAKSEQAANMKDANDYKSYIQSGRYFLIPSFFSLMRTLKKAKREFAIVLRGFGQNLKVAVNEFNAYRCFTQ